MLYFHKKTHTKHLAIILSCLLFSILHTHPAVSASEGKDKQPPTFVVVTPARMHTVTDTVETIGTLSANESVNITATVTDTISAIHFEDGQQVEKGEPLVEMTSNEEHAGIAEMRSSLQEAKAQYHRAQQLVKDRTLAQAVADERKRDYETARAKLRATESRMSDRLIVAPFSGVLGLRQVSVGTLVQPGTQITTIDDVHVMKCDFTIPSSYLSIMRSGLSITATSDAFPEQSFSGKVVAVDSRIDDTTRQIRARAIIDNPDNLLRSGLVMSIRLLSAPRSALLIPESAIVPLGSEHFVYLAANKDGKTIAQKQKIIIRKRHDAMVEVSSGIKEGDSIISEGTMTLTDGKEISIKQPSNEKTAPASEVK